MAAVAARRRPQPRRVHRTRDQPPLAALPVPIQPPQPILAADNQVRPLPLEEDEIVEVNPMDTRDIYVIAWIEDNKDPRIKVLCLASDDFVHLRRQGSHFARLGLEDAGALERLCPRRQEWLPMDLDEGQFIGESGALLIRSAGIKHLPSIDVYQTLID